MDSYIDKQYFQPEIFDLFVGYECEKLVVGEYKSWYEPYVIKTVDAGYGLLETAYGEINNSQYRTKFLCRQDIIDLGWEHKQYVKDSELVFNFVKGEWYLEYWVGKIPYIEIGREGYDTGYAGNCKSKNELSKLMKDYLNIPI